MALILRRERIKFCAQPEIKGNPDFRILGVRIVVFCDSSFWHGRWVHTQKAEKFHKNQEFWQAKLIENRRRDRKVSQGLRKRGWVVLRFWDEDILQHSLRVSSRIRRAIKSFDLPRNGVGGGAPLC